MSARDSRRERFRRPAQPAPFNHNSALQHAVAVYSTRVNYINSQLQHEVRARRAAQAQLENVNSRLEQMVRDKTEELQQANEQLKSLSDHDPLTGLLNRRGVEDALRRESKRANREGEVLFAILVDLDDFKRVNDSLGHAVGDLALQTVANALLSATRATDQVGRIGGDEFLILANHNRQGDSRRFAEKMRLAVGATPVPISDGELTVTASLALAAVTDDMQSITELLTETHALLKRSKQSGKNRVSTVGAGEHGPSETLNDAIRSGCGYRAVRQPIMRLGEGTVVGYEFLSRFEHSGFEMPQNFFALCWEQNLLTVADRHCFSKCAQASCGTTPQMRRHINLFPSTLLNLEPQTILDLLPDDQPPESYTLELSEQQLFGDPTQLLEVVNCVRRTGVQIAIDDVGFGRSCLEALVVLHPDVVKIDKRFVTNAGQCTMIRRSLERLLRVAEALEAIVVAEGIETKEDLSTLCDLGVTYGQGYLWGRPA